MAVSLYFPAETGAPTSHTFGLRPTYVSKEGDFTAAAEVADLGLDDAVVLLGGRSRRDRAGLTPERW